MPCPEATYQSLEKNIVRCAKGFKYYNHQDFIKHCDELANQVIEIIKALITAKYEIVAVLGIEYSPSCAVNYQFSRGTVRKAGIFINLLRSKLSEQKISLQFIGINRRGTKKAEQRLRELIYKSEKINS